MRPKPSSQAFSRAAVVIAPHGAGLANTVVCAPGTLIVEFFPAHEANICFMAMAAKLGLRYRSIVGEASRVPGKSAFENQARRTTIHVTLAAVGSPPSKASVQTVILPASPGYALYPSAQVPVL